MLSTDPENSLHDSLSLNTGIENMVTMATPFAFLKRMAKPDGMKELFEVMSKWNRGKIAVIVTNTTSKMSSHLEIY